MKVGDLIKYRDRIPTDPHPRDIFGGGSWGDMGIVIDIINEQWEPFGDYVPSIVYVDFGGDRVICKQEDVEVINGRKS